MPLAEVIPYPGYRASTLAAVANQGDDEKVALEEKFTVKSVTSSKRPYRKSLFPSESQVSAVALRI